MNMQKNEFDKVDIALVSRLKDEPVLSSKKSVGVADWERARLQHDLYCATLQKCGVQLQYTEAPNDTAQMLNDMAVVIDDLAIIANFSENDPRQTEKMSLASKLAVTKIIKFIEAPGRLDSEDVLKLGNSFFIRMSGKTNSEGAAQTAFFLSEFGHKVTVLEADKNADEPFSKAALYLGNDVVLIRENLAKHFAFIGYKSFAIPYENRGALDAVMINGTLIMPTGFASVAASVKAIGINVEEITISEFQKLGAGMQCLSLLISKPVENDISIPAPAEMDVKLAKAA